MTIRIVDGYLKELIRYANGREQMDRHMWDGRVVYGYSTYLQARRIRKRYLDNWVYLGAHRWKLKDGTFIESKYYWGDQEQLDY